MARSFLKEKLKKLTSSNFETHFKRLIFSFSKLLFYSNDVTNDNGKRIYIFVNIKPHTTHNYKCLKHTHKYSYVVYTFWKAPGKKKMQRKPTRTHDPFSSALVHLSLSFFGFFLPILMPCRFFFFQQKENLKPDYII